MEHIDATNIPLSFCPSAEPEMAGSMVLGVVEGTVDEPRVGYLAEPLPVTDRVLALSRPVEPTEIFRFAAPCANSACQHFDGSHCLLATRIVQLLPAGRGGIASVPTALKVPLVATRRQGSMSTLSSNCDTNLPSI